MNTTKKIEHCVVLGEIHELTDAMVENAINEFAQHGLKVNREAIEHNYNAWKHGYKSGYRDEENGTHLFSPCGCNPLSFWASALNPEDSNWQETYFC